MLHNIVIKKPKENIIGLIPFNNELLSNDNMQLNMTNIFLKKNKYFSTIDKKKNIDEKLQIIDYMNTKYDLHISENNIYYIGLRGNVVIYSIFIENKKDLNQGNLNDYSNYNEYSWKTFFDINFDNNLNNYEENVNKKYNLHYNHFIISENKKQKISIEELYYFLKKQYKNKLI